MANESIRFLELQRLLFKMPRNDILRLSAFFFLQTLLIFLDVVTTVLLALLILNSSDSSPKSIMDIQPFNGLNSFLAESELVWLFSISLLLLLLLKVFAWTVLLSRLYVYTSDLSVKQSNNFLKLMFDDDSYKFYIPTALTIIRDISSQLYSSTVVAFLSLYSEFLFLFFLLGAFFLLYPTSTTLFIVTFCLSGFFFIVLIKRPRLRIANDLLVANTRADESVSDAIANLESQKIMGNSENLLANHFVLRTTAMRAKAKLTFFSLLPKYFFESVLFVSLLVICTFAIVSTTPVSSLQTVFGSFLILASRLGPSIIKINGFFDTIHQGMGAVTFLNHDFRRHVSAESFQFNQVSNEFLRQAPSCGPKIETLNLTLHFPDPQFTVKVEDINFRAKTFNLIHGPSGSGKSTLLKAMTGRIRPLTGRVLIDSVDARKWINESSSKIGYASSLDTLVSGNIFDNVFYGRTYTLNQKSYNALRNLLNLVCLEELAALSDYALNNLDLSELSAGQKQRLISIRAIVNDPVLVFLDEAYSSLDGPTEKRILNNFREKLHHSTFVIVAHKVKDFSLYENQIELSKVSVN